MQKRVTLYYQAHVAYKMCLFAPLSSHLPSWYDGEEGARPSAMSDPHSSTLTTLASLLHALPTVQERLPQALTFACGALAAERGVMIPNHRYYPLMPPATYGCSPTEWLSPRFAFARSLVFHTFQSGVASLTSDAQPDCRHDIAQAIGLHSIVCAPVVHQPSPYAVLCLQRRLTTAPFTPDDLDLLECIAVLVNGEG